MSKLLIDEPPLQVLPSLAKEIGLNEAIVLQQLHYLLRDPRFGRKLAEEKWIFNTVEQWRCGFFPFWSNETIKRTFSSLASQGLIVTCQPEGRLSRRKYYRIDLEKVARISDGVKLTSSMGSECADGKGSICAVPITKTTQRLPAKKSKETEESTSGEAVAVDEEVLGRFHNLSKEQQLARIKRPTDYPSEREFEQFISDHEVDQIGMGKKSDLYWQLCRDKWHHWNGDFWYPIINWKKFIQGLDRKIETATTGGF